MKVVAAMLYNIVVGAGFEEIHHCEMSTFVHFSKCVASTLSVLCSCVGHISFPEMPYFSHYVQL